MDFERFIEKINNNFEYKTIVKKVLSNEPCALQDAKEYLKDDKEKDDMLNLWKKLPVTASKKENIYIIDDEYSGISSHRVKYLIDDFKGILEDVRAKKF